MADSQHLFRLKKAYGAALPSSRALPSELVSLSDHNSLAQFQNELVNELLLAPHFRDYPPSRESRRIFWKCVVEHLEMGGEEVDERVYDAYLNLISERTSSFVTRPPSPSYNTHFWSLDLGGSQNPQNTRLTTLLESRTMIEGGTTGLRTWTASLEFANWLVVHPGVVQDRRVLELGAGAGFLGLVVAQLQVDHLDHDYSCSPSLVLSDVNSEVLSRCRQNFQLPCNRMSNHPSLEFRLLDWSDALDSEANLDPHSIVNEILQGVDTIIGADLVYDASIVPALTAVLALFFRTNHIARAASRIARPCAYIALTVRREKTVSAFLSCLSSHRLQYDEVEILVGASRKQFLGGTVDGANCNVKLIRVSQAS